MYTKRWSKRTGFKKICWAAVGWTVGWKGWIGLDPLLTNWLPATSYALASCHTLFVNEYILVAVSTDALGCQLVVQPTRRDYSKAE